MVVGILITILFDMFRILRRSFKTADFITYIEDILFWILAGTILLYTLFIFNNGEIRFYFFIAMMIGSMLYIVLFSKYVIQISVKIVTFCAKPFQKVYNFLQKMLKRGKEFYKNRPKKSKKVHFFEEIYGKKKGF